jgi:glycogen operon protein
MMDEVDELGVHVSGDSLLMLFNSHHEPIPFQLPMARPGHVWETVLDTYDPQAPIHTYEAGDQYGLHGRTMAVMRSVPAPT